MATSRFLMSTDVAHLTPLTENGKPVVESYPSISEHLSGKNLATLLAEPAMGDYSEGHGYNTVRWHSPLDGNPTAYVKLRESARESHRERLTQFFSTLTELIPSHPQKNMLLKALLIPDRSDLYIISGNIVLINWGFVPNHAAGGETALRNHFQSIYGEFCDIDQIWPLQSQADKFVAVAPGVVSGVTDSEKSTAPVQDGGNTSPPIPPSNPPERPSATGWRSSGFWVFMALFMILLGMLLGWFTSDYYEPRIWPEGVDAVKTHKLLNDSLRKERDDLRALLKEPVCDREDIQTILDPGEEEIKQLPSEKGDTSDNSQQAHASAIKTVELLEQSAVMVIVPSKGGTSSGTGFLVSPTHVVTNKHVVEKCTGKEVVIINKRLGKVVKATILSVSKAPLMNRRNQYNGGVRDYAVLKLSESIPLVPLKLTPSVAKLAPVYAGGYPGFFTKGDPALQKLSKGDFTQAPEMIPTKGEVLVVQKRVNRVPLVIHSADISQGNSGGPLIDRCGRVVGVNTFGNVDSQSGRRGLYALASSDLMTFLNEVNVQFQESKETCE